MLAILNTTLVELHNISQSGWVVVRFIGNDHEGASVKQSISIYHDGQCVAQREPDPDLHTIDLTPEMQQAIVAARVPMTADELLATYDEEDYAGSETEQHFRAQYPEWSLVKHYA